MNRIEQCILIEEAEELELEHDMLNEVYHDWLDTRASIFRAQNAFRIGIRATDIEVGCPF